MQGPRANDCWNSKTVVNQSTTFREYFPKFPKIYNRESPITETSFGPNHDFLDKKKKTVCNLFKLQTNKKNKSKSNESYSWMKMKSSFQNRKETTEVSDIEFHYESVFICWLEYFLKFFFIKKFTNLWKLF